MLHTQPTSKIHTFHTDGYWFGVVQRYTSLDNLPHPNFSAFLTGTPA